MIPSVTPPKNLNLAPRTHLTSAENRCYAVAYQDRGDLDARRRMIEGNLRLVAKEVMRYRRRDVAMEDLMSAGTEGLIEAIDRYDPHREDGATLATFAVWQICYRIQQHIMKHSQGVQVPESLSKKAGHLAHTERRLTQSLAGKPSPQQLADQLGWDVAQVVAVRSLDGLTRSDWDDVREGSIADATPDDTVDVLEYVANWEMIEQLHHAMEETLSPRDREIFERSLGLNQREPETHHALAQAFNLTPRQVRTIIERAKDALERALTGAPN